MESVFLPGRGLPSSVRRVSERASVSLANPLTRKEGERLAKQRRAERAQLRPREHSDRRAFSILTRRQFRQQFRTSLQPPRLLIWSECEAIIDLHRTLVRGVTDISAVQ